ncbi:MAG: hypothetical protein ACRC62_33020 [Microcoleus sp.]
MADDAKAGEAKAEDEKPDPMFFKGVCKDGVLKGKEIEGKLDIKVNVAKVTTPDDKQKPKPGWETTVFWFLFLLVANLVAGDPAGIRKYSSPQGSHSSQIVNPSGEQSVLPKQKTTNLQL